MRPRFPQVARYVGLLVAFVALAAACNSSSSPLAADPSTSSLPAYIPVGAKPSVSSRMICETEAVDDVATAIGARTTQPPTGTWRDHLYTCVYRYRNATMTLSVEELSTAAQTTAYFDGLADSLHKHAVLQIGQGGFVADDGSAVVRKDYKVLRVDVTGLPATFGRPPTERGDIAANVAITILGCWTGA